MDLVVALIWPTLIAGILYWLRNDIHRLFRAFVDRVEGGDSVEAGGLKIGQSQPKLPTDLHTLDVATSKQADPGPPHKVYLLHKYTRDKTLDKDRRSYYRLNIWLECDGIDLSTISSVAYHLHPTFENPIRIVNDHGSAFNLDTSAWGSFLLYADVNFQNGTKWRIERYLNF